MSRIARSVFGLFLCLCILGSPLVWSQDEVDPENIDVEQVDGEESQSGRKTAIYLPIKPQFVVNYGGGTKLKYLKAMVTVRVGSSAGANAVRHHLPYIRNNLVLLFASQTDETLSSQIGKEAMRQAALSEIRELLAREDGLPPTDIMDVLFNSLTWH